MGVRKYDSDVCSVPGCGRKRTSFGWCQGHYQRWRALGDIHAEVPIRVRGELTYVGIHKRLRTKRGKPSDYLCFVCGKTPGANWAFFKTNTPNFRIGTAAYKFLAYSIDINDYEAMCRGCHAWFDRHH